MPKILIVACTLLLIFVFAGYGQTSEFAGRYSDENDYAVYFQQTKYGLTIRPVMWTATQLLVPNGRDKFVVIDRASRGAEFLRDAAGKISGVRIVGMDGEGLTLKRESGRPLAVELFLAGRTAEAAKAYRSRGPTGVQAALDIARQVLVRLPTKSRSVVAFLNALAPDLRNDAAFHSLLGLAYVHAGDRRSGLKSFQLAHQLDASNEEAISGLFRLAVLPSASKRNGGWSVPFPLSAVFAKPTDSEIRSVEADWAARDLSTSNVKEVTSQTITFRNWKGTVRVVSHLVHGSLHYGAIIVPAGATPGSCPVIVDAKGVSPSYFPLTVENIESVSMMGDLGGKFIYVVPSFRGEVMHIGDKTFTSEGDRRDALDGAADDAIALLNVALKTTPEADADRICAFGHSRGGTVALLLGIRDRRIKCVVEWSGPTDWFYLMGTGGWTEQELWSEGIRIHADPMQIGGQNLERFYSKAIEGKASLADVRHNMIASSPLYFAERLPMSQFHYGLEDPSVPTRNGYALVEELKRHNVPPTRYQAYFYPGEGHDTDRINGPVTSREFILKVLGVK